jgi:hypothetical protein|tara:strand:- start:7533 stop:7655 length:123 start_codon:yes stop_codon:yes gene_type:complete
VGKYPEIAKVNVIGKQPKVGTEDGVFNIYNWFYNIKNIIS